MKTKYGLTKFVVFLTLLIGTTQISYSQCNNGTQYGGTTAPTGGGSNTISGCNYASEYAPVTGVAAATDYQITSSIATDFITVRQGTSGGPVIASGVQPLNWTSTVGGTYYIHFNTNAACGTQSSCRNTVITHVPVPLPSPDDPCTAHTIVVGCGGSKLSGDNTGMTNSGIAAPSCGSYAGGDVWYSLVVPASGIIKIETYAGTLTDVAMAVYSVSGGCGGTLTQITCDDNSGFGNMSKMILNGQTPGNTLYIRVWDKNNNQTGTFEIDASDLSSDYCVTGNGIDQGSGCAQLTSATNNQLGSIWDADDRFDFTSDWTFDFSVNLGSSDGGADGVCFVIQNDPAGLGASGTSGGSMGAGGIANSLIFEIDTYINTEDRNDGLTGLGCASGPDWDHLDVWLNGNVNPGTCSSGARVVPSAVELMNGAALYNIENGLNHTLRISYVSASQTITATILNAATTVTYGAISYSPVNAMTLFGTNAPYFGFTSSTGGLNNQQSACLAPSLILPITLADFDINCENNRVQIDWTTTSEINNDYFTIERSRDGINFEDIATISGAGNSNSVLNYSWIDEAPLNTVAYYRLKQTDFDRQYSYSKLQATECQSNNEINIYPNPAADAFSFDYYMEKNEELTIEMYNMSGQLVLQKQFNDLPVGASNSLVNIETLSNGIYYVKFSTPNGQFINKLSIVD